MIIIVILGWLLIGLTGGIVVTKMDRDSLTVGKAIFFCLAGLIMWVGLACFLIFEIIPWDKKIFDFRLNKDK